MLKVAVIGAGSTYTPELVEGILRRRDSFPVTELALMDIDARKLQIVGALAQRMAAHVDAGLRVRLTMDLDDALRDADFVMAQIRVGKLPARHLDESIPLQYGLLGQETTGIGGFFKGLRTIPVMLDIAERMQALCPHAWLINFSNPSGMVAEALLRHTPVRMMGLCNAPINMLRAARAAVQDDDAAVELVGLNHLTWITSVISHGTERLPELIEQGYSGPKPANLPSRAFDPACMRAAGGIPNSYLQYYYEREKRLAQQLVQEKTRAQVCMDIEEDLLALYGDEGLYEKPALLDKRGGHLYSEAAVSLAEAIHNDTGAVHAVNVRSGGVLPYLDPDEVGELLCTVGRNGATPIPVRATGSRHIAGIVSAVKAYERLAVEAAIAGDRDLALAALMTHPLIGDFDRASACFDAMLEAHRQYLPRFFGEA